MKVISKIALFIWNISEYTGIGLGRFAPYVFALMIGKRKFYKITKK